jgi:hypothetical protein
MLLIGVLPGHRAELSVSFDESRTRLNTLAVPDGNLEASQETSVVVLDPPVKKGFLGTPATPGFETALAFVALSGTAFSLALRRRRN